MRWSRERSRVNHNRIFARIAFAAIFAISYLLVTLPIAHLLRGHEHLGAVDAKELSLNYAFTLALFMRLVVLPAVLALGPDLALADIPTGMITVLATLPCFVSTEQLLPWLGVIAPRLSSGEIVWLGALVEALILAFAMWWIRRHSKGMRAAGIGAMASIALSVAICGLAVTVSH